MLIRWGCMKNGIVSEKIGGGTVHGIKADTRIQLFASMLSFAMLVACGKSIVVDTDFPDPVIQPLPLKIGIHYEDAFTQYSYSEELPNDIEWSFDLGGANRKLFDNLFSALFDITSPVAGNGGPDPAYDGLDAVITPAVEAFEFSLPRQSHSDQYAVWIRYNLQVYAPDGTLITKWPVSAYGQSDAHSFGANAAMKEAVIKAMRDAAASIIMGFAEEQKIKEALLGDANGS